MIVKFQHKGKLCSAYLNEQAPANNILTAYMLDCNNDLGYQVIFIKDEVNGWTTTASIKQRFPDTYSNFCKSLNGRLR